MESSAKQEVSQSAVSRILFPPTPLRATADDDHSSSPVITDGIKQPTRKHQTGRLVPTLASGRAPLFGLAPCGVLPATDVATGAVRSYRTFSPLLARLSTSVSGMFSVPLILRVAPTGRYPAHCPAEFGLSSLRLRPCGLRRTAIIWRSATVYDRTS